MIYNKPVCVGAGLVALDIIMNGSTKPKGLFAGGSCGNVLTILSFLGWDSYPIARLAKNEATNFLLRDLKYWKVNTNFLFKEDSGSTPIIIQRNFTDKNGNPAHRFEFKCPETGKYLPQYKPILAKTIENLDFSNLECDFFYFDRVKRSSVELAKNFKSKGSTIFFEPTSNTDIKLFKESIKISDIIKFSSDRIKGYEDIDNIDNRNKLEIITLGKNGLKFRYDNSEWKHIQAHRLEKITDSSGAGDWTSASLINSLFENKFKLDTSNKLSMKDIAYIIKTSQSAGALNCFYEGARGLMYELKNKETFIKYLDNFEKNEFPTLTEINSHILPTFKVCDLLTVSC